MPVFMSIMYEKSKENFTRNVDIGFLLQSPMAAGMRGALDSPVCFPISSGTGSNQFMPPMSAGYSKLESPLPPPSGSVHTNYMQVRHILHVVASDIDRLFRCMRNMALFLDTPIYRC